MKKVFILVILTTLSLNEISCTNPNAINIHDNFILTDKKVGFTKDDPRVSAFSFEYSGKIINQTKNIFKEAKVTMTIEFTLENGRVLTDVDMDPAKDAFGAAEAFETIYMYQPNQSYDIKELKTVIIDEDYLKYPVKFVKVYFKIQLTDEINNTDTEEDIKSENITNEWSKAVNGNFKKDFHQAEIDSNNANLEKLENHNN